ncbi:galactose-specific lectin nattectin-like isoform 4-T4 [Spinachia spinachia]
MNQIKENQTTLLATNQNLTKLREQLKLEKESLKLRLENMTQNYNVSEGKNTELKAQIQQLTEDNQEQKENFTKQIQVLEDNGETSNVSRAQWSIDSYCPKKEVLSGRTCSACQKGWKKNQQRCYVIHDSEGTSDLKTWEEAQENCRERAADLVVVHDEEEKRIIDDYSANFRVSNGYWIGLRAKGGTWKWIDGTTLTDISWIEAPAEGHCGVSLSTRRWTSVKCDEKRTRICTRNALSL